MPDFDNPYHNLDINDVYYAIFAIEDQIELVNTFYNYYFSRRHKISIEERGYLADMIKSLPKGTQNLISYSINEIDKITKGQLNNMDPSQRTIRLDDEN